MKRILYIFLGFVLVACDTHEVTHEFERTFVTSRQYSIYLDTREIRTDIQVKPPINIDTAFKIVANDRFVFVGEAMKGIHVFEKNTGQPLNFIQINHLRAFDVVDDMLFSNNFVDLLIIDVENPSDARILHREKDFFNRFNDSTLNLRTIYNPLIRSYMYEIGLKVVNLTVTVTHTNPDPDFSEADELYGNFIVTEIPTTIPHAATFFIFDDMPFAGIINVAGNIYTFGDNNIMRISYSEADGLRTSQSVITIPNYRPNNHLRYKDGMIFIFGRNLQTLFLDYHNILTQNHSSIGWFGSPIDVVSVREPENSFVGLNSNHFLVGVTLNIFPNILTPTSMATSIINVNDTILALGSQLTLHRFFLRDNIRVMERVGEYPNISGMAMLRESNTLFVANRNGLFIYDISDLKNITLKP